VLRSATARLPAEDPNDKGAEPAIGLLRQRDPRAWRDFFLRETPAIFRYVRARLDSAEDAEDLTSQVFEEAWRHIETLQDRGLPPRAWLYGIARNVVGTHRRRLFQRPPILAIEAFDGTGGDPAGTPETLDMVRAITSLKRSQAEIIALRFVHGLSLQETAMALGTSVDGVKGRQARALAELRDRLDGKNSP
jgi:RNA polymerase sigma-70 factor (ECF subfamily)